MNEARYREEERRLLESFGVKLGVTVDDSQVGRQVAQPMTSEEALRLFNKTFWPDSDRDLTRWTNPISS
ncbi:MAG: hypothetical protein GEU71_16925 [Actinobacteria bacterium]|nr:hypothetical protein [Actinomycetota bacterium]